MNLPGFLAPSMAMLAALALPIVLFYFLRLKRTRLEVSSLFLWQQVLADHRVNAPFQKFKRNLLLWLQLLILLLLILAAMQPYRRAAGTPAKRLPILIDCSASMGARDKPGGLTRLAVAKKQIRNLIDGLAADQQLCLIRFAHTARKLTRFTNNKRLLRKQLDAITYEDVPGELDHAIRIADALSKTEPFDKIVLYSDGNFPNRTDFALPFEIDYQKIDNPGTNLGITLMNAQRNQAGRWDLLVKVAAANTPANGTLQLWQGQQRLAVEDLHVDPQSPKRLLFHLAKTTAGQTITAKLQPDDFDALASDNTASLTLTGLRPLRVYIRQSLQTYRMAFSGMKQIVLLRRSELRKPPVDLLISDLPDAPSHDAPVVMRVGSVPPPLASRVKLIPLKGTRVVSWNPLAPLLNHVQLNDLILLDQPRRKDHVREVDFEEHGYEILIHGTRGPILLRKQTDTTLEYNWLVHTDRTTLPYRVGFPVMLANLARIARDKAGLLHIDALHTGILKPLQLPSSGSYTIIRPDRTIQIRKTDHQGKLAGIQATRVGTYQINRSSQMAAKIQVNLLNARETSLQGVKEIQFNELSIHATHQALQLDRSFWPVLAWLAMGVLLFEWWYFHRPILPREVRKTHA